MLDRDKRVDAAEQHGVPVDEVDGDDAAGLGGKELLPGRAGPAGRGTDPGVVQDLPDRGRRDPVAEPDEFPLDVAVSPCVVLRGDARTAAAVGGRPGRCRLCGPICALPADGARRAAPQVSPGTPVPTGGGEPIVTVRPARAGRLACNGLGRPGGARLRSRAGAPAAQHLWTTASVPAPSGSVRAVRQATGKLSVNPRQIVRVTSRCEGDRQPYGGLSDAGFLLAAQVFMATGRSICTTTDIPDSGWRPESGRHGGVAARLVGPYLRWRWLVAAGHRGRPAPG